MLHLNVQCVQINFVLNTAKNLDKALEVLNLKQIDNETETKRSYLDKDGKYTIIGLKPGTYKVKYYNSKSKATSEVKSININHIK